MKAEIIASHVQSGNCRLPWKSVPRAQTGLYPGRSRGVSSTEGHYPHLCHMEFYQVLCERWAFIMSKMNNDK